MSLPLMLAALLAALALPLAPAPATAQDGQRDYSAAERLLFMSDQLGAVTPPTTLRYAFRHSGTLEPAFDDSVVLVLKAGSGGRCCATHTEFLSGARRLTLPDVPAAEGNPVLLHFLEHDIREMQRLTGGAQNHFRKRIRMAIYQGATVADVSVPYRGRAIAAKEIRITPFVDDPNRPRYEKLAVKEYRFTLSDAVPGGLYAVRTRIAAADSAAPALLVDEIHLEGAQAHAGP